MTRGNVDFDDDKKPAQTKNAQPLQQWIIDATMQFIGENAPLLITEGDEQALPDLLSLKGSSENRSADYSAWLHTHWSKEQHQLLMDLIVKKARTASKEELPVCQALLKFANSMKGEIAEIPGQPKDKKVSTARSKTAGLFFQPAAKVGNQPQEKPDTKTIRLKLIDALSPLQHRLAVNLKELNKRLEEASPREFAELLEDLSKNIQQQIQSLSKDIRDQKRENIYERTLQELQNADIILDQLKLSIAALQDMNTLTRV